MKTTLAEINDIIKAAGIDPAELTAIISDIKAAVRASDAGVIEDLEKKLIQARADAEASLNAANDKSAKDAAQAKADADRALKDALEKAASDLDEAKKSYNDDIGKLDIKLDSIVARYNGEIATLKQQLESANKALDETTDSMRHHDALLDEARRQYTGLGKALVELSKSSNERAKEAIEKRKAELQAELEKLA